MAGEWLLSYWGCDSNDTESHDYTAAHVSKENSNDSYRNK